MRTSDTLTRIEEVLTLVVLAVLAMGAGRLIERIIPQDRLIASGIVTIYLAFAISIVLVVRHE